MKKNHYFSALWSFLLLLSQTASAEKLRLLTWDSYAPEQVINLFEQKYPDIEVEVTISNNEGFVEKLQATDAGGFDLVQPSHDRIYSVQLTHNLYKPIDLSKINISSIDEALLASVKVNTTIDDKLYSIPYFWGTSGLLINSSKAKNVNSWTDICEPRFKGKASMRLKRTILLGFAFAMGKNPFEAYHNLEEYQQLLDEVADKIISCKDNINTYWTNGHALADMVLNNEIVISDTWDNTAYRLYVKNPDIRYIPPKEGALAWIDTFALPRNGKADDAAYKWINFVLQPEIIKLMSEKSGAIAAVKNGIDLMPMSTKSAVRSAFDAEAVRNLRYFANVPPGVEAMEARTLKKIMHTVSN